MIKIHFGAKRGIHRAADQQFDFDRCHSPPTLVGHYITADATYNQEDGRRGQTPAEVRGKQSELLQPTNFF